MRCWDNSLCVLKPYRGRLTPRHVVETIQKFPVMSEQFSASPFYPCCSVGVSLQCHSNRKFTSASTRSCYKPSAPRRLPLCKGHRCPPQPLIQICSCLQDREKEYMVRAGRYDCQFMTNPRGRRPSAWRTHKKLGDPQSFFCSLKAVPALCCLLVGYDACRLAGAW